MTHKFNEIKEVYSDEMKLTGQDILNTVSGGNGPKQFMPFLLALTIAG